MKSKNREYGPSTFAAMLGGLAEAAERIEREELHQMEHMVIIKRSAAPNIAGSEFSQENELVPGALKARIDRIVDGKLIVGTGSLPAKRAIQIVREAVLCHQALADEYRVVVIAQRSEEQIALATENLARYRRSRICMPKIADARQVDMDDDSLRNYMRLAQQRTRDRRKIRGGH
jgi:hypothetical protein